MGGLKGWIFAFVSSAPMVGVIYWLGYDFLTLEAWVVYIAGGWAYAIGGISK